MALIGGLDPSGGAGLLRDGWTVTIRAPELEQLVACTALTRQGRGRPVVHDPSPRAAFEAQLQRIAAHPRLRAVKIGMVPAPALDPLLDLLADLRGRPSSRRPAVVWDPVIDASAGGRLGAPAEAMLELAARVDLLTPNRDEHLQLDAAGALPVTLAVLFKGEALADRPDRIRDRLRDGLGNELIIERPRLRGPDPRGTGCALASAIAAELARGRSLSTACVAAIAWLDGARRRTRETPDGAFLPGPR